MSRVKSLIFVGLALLYFRRTTESEFNRTKPSRNRPSVRLDRVTSSRAIANGIEIRSGASVMQISALRDDVLRVRVGPAGQLPEDASWAVLPASRTSTAAVTAESSATSVGFKTAKLHVSVHKDPFELTVTDLGGHVIAADFPGRPIEYHGASFRVYMKSPVRRALLRPGRQAWPARPAQPRLY